MEINLRKLVLSLSISFLISLNISFSQECGQDQLREEYFSQATQQEKEQWINDSRLANKSISNLVYRKQSIDIPIHVYVIRKSNGKGGSTENELMRGLEVLNQDYSSTPYQFYYHEIEYINSDQYFVILNDSEANSLYSQYNNSDALNMYVSGYLKQGFNGFARFPWTSNSNAFFFTHHAINTAIYAHEIGHYFGLFHTHETFQGTEFVDGTNCSSAGDLLCDTPADPLITAVNIDSTCMYTGNVTDPKGDSYSPEPRNIMSYARMECRDLFTSDQIGRMNFYYDNYRASELGNLSEFVPQNSCAAFDDDDADGVCNANDVCPESFDVDMDSNGVIDACESCPVINFELSAVQLYSQDGNNDFWYNWTWINANYLHLQENSWKAIPIQYTVTVNTRIAFDFKSSIEAEIHELSFDNDLTFPPDQRFILYGSQAVSGANIYDFPYTQAGNFQHYNIPLGDNFTGYIEYLILSVDEDNSSGGHIPGNSFFRNVRIFEDPDADGLCDTPCVIGTACDDGDVCTTGEVYDSSCMCSGGTLVDSDNDGICDTDDQCPGLNDNVIGIACDDGDVCTIGEVYDSSCMCSGGTLVDSDNDGICDTDDQCPGSDDLMDNNNNGVPDGCDPDYIPTSDCNNIIYLTGIESFYIHQANNTIYSEQTVDGQYVKYSAEIQINLLQDFEVVIGSTFEAVIDGCN